MIHFKFRVDSGMSRIQYLHTLLLHREVVLLFAPIIQGIKLEENPDLQLGNRSKALTKRSTFRQ